MIKVDKIVDMLGNGHFDLVVKIRSMLLTDDSTMPGDTNYKVLINFDIFTTKNMDEDRSKIIFGNTIDLGINSITLDYDGYVTDMNLIKAGYEKLLEIEIFKSGSKI